MSIFRPRKSYPEVHDEVEKLRREVNALRHDLDDLFHRFKRFQGRHHKEAALQGDGDAPQVGSVVGTRSMPTVAELRAAGRWRW